MARLGPVRLIGSRRRRRTTMGRPAPLRHDCVEVPCRVDGTVNGNCVVDSVESGLTPTRNSRGIVVRDHLASHKTKAVRRGSRAISAAGAALLHPPKDASDLNPIEQPFAKLKHGLRGAAERTRDTLCRALAQVLDTVSATECANDLVNGGYTQT